MQNMKIRLVLGLVAIAVCATCGAVVLEPGRTEVVIGGDAPKTVRFAAMEMTNFLAQAWGRTVPLVTTRTPGRAALVLGGEPTANLPRDGFVIEAGTDVIRIYGEDDPKADLAAQVAAGIVDGASGLGVRNSAHGTLFGVYEFLERHVGVRFYFPGDMGTVIPRVGPVKVPAGRAVKSPAWAVRSVYMAGDGLWPGEVNDGVSRRAPKALNWLRLRLESQSVPCCHGLNNFQFSDRFHETHPEWFALVTDPVTGKPRRYSGVGAKGELQTGHLCYSNDEMWDQVYRDICAYFDGKDPSALGIKRVWNSRPDGWGPNFKGNYVDVMQQDAMKKCECEKCKAAYDESRGIRGYASDLIWSKTSALAKRLADGGYPAILTQSTYVWSPYYELPTCSLASNMVIQVAQGGPWSMGNPDVLSNEVERLSAWADKVGHKVFTWTYPTKLNSPQNSFEFGIVGLPNIAPHAWADYYRLTSKWSMGSFAETECERAMLNYLNYYVFAKLAWDPDLNLEALLDEHYRLMFGAGAGEMKRAFEIFEQKWMGDIQGTLVETPKGRLRQVPNVYDRWNRVWGKRAIGEVGGLFATALRKTKGDSLSNRRVAFMKREIFDPLVAERTRVLDEISVTAALRRRAARKPGNLLENADFEAGTKGWSLPKSAAVEKGGVSRGGQCLRVFSADGTSSAQAQQMLEGKLRPETTYRLSFFVRLKDVRRMELYRGCFASVYDGASWYGVNKGNELMLGTADWYYVEGVFTTGKRPTTGNKPYFLWGFNGSVAGTAWVDGIILEEVR